MTSPTDRAAEAPRILGVEMVPAGTKSWALDFASFSVRLDWHRGEIYNGIAFGGVAAWRKPLPDCIAAIERELLAIRDSIPVPTRAAEPPQPASVGGVEDERIRRFALCNHDILLRDCAVCREPPHPSNELESARDAVIAAAREVDGPPYGGVTAARSKLKAALSELERRLTVKT